MNENERIRALEREVAALQDKLEELAVMQFTSQSVLRAAISHAGVARQVSETLERLKGRSDDIMLFHPISDRGTALAQQLIDLWIRLLRSENPPAH